MSKLLQVFSSEITLVSSFVPCNDMSYELQMNYLGICLTILSVYL